MIDQIPHLVFTYHSPLLLSTSRKGKLFVNKYKSKLRIRSKEEDRIEIQTFKAGIIFK